MLRVKNQLFIGWSQHSASSYWVSLSERQDVKKCDYLEREECKSWGEALCFPPSVRTFRWEETERKGLEPNLPPTPHPTTLVP